MVLSLHFVLPLQSSDHHWKILLASNYKSWTNRLRIASILLLRSRIKGFFPLKFRDLTFHRLSIVLGDTINLSCSLWNPTKMLLYTGLTPRQLTRPFTDHPPQEKNQQGHHESILLCTPYRNYKTICKLLNTLILHASSLDVYTQDNIASSGCR